jgi:type II secretory pathway component GspD/PulD (secretin)
MQARILLVGVLGFTLLGGLLDAAGRSERQKNREGRKTARKAEEKLMVKTYNVADLVVPVSDFLSPAKEESKTQEKSLIKLIHCMVDPASWSEAGGRGNMQYYPIGMALVIKQTGKNHQEIHNLLADLRRLQDIEVAVEMRLVTFSPENKTLFPRSEPMEVVYLNDQETKELMNNLQEDRRTNIMQAPKITMFNGQRARVEVSEAHNFVVGMKAVEKAGQVVMEPQTKTYKDGIQFNVCPVVAEDGKTVRVHLELRVDSVDTHQMPMIPVHTKDASSIGVNFLQVPRASSQVVERTLELADGQTGLIFGGKSEKEVRKELGHPLLGKIPLADRVFRNVAFSREVVQMAILVTARIIVAKEEEINSVHNKE